MSGSAKSGSKSWPKALSRVKKRTPKLTIVNQCATATTGSRDMRVWPRNSRSEGAGAGALVVAAVLGLAEPEGREEVVDRLDEQGDGHGGHAEADDDGDDLERTHAGESTDSVSKRLVIVTAVAP